jgi:restriction system protein
MADRFGLSGEERERLLPSGRQTLIGNRTHWAITYLAKTDLLERTRRGFVRITERGRATLSERPVRIDLKYLSRFPEFGAFHARRNTQANGDEPVLELVEKKGATPDELIRSAHAQIDAALREELVSRILTSPPAFFERLIVRLLVAMGFGGQYGASAEAIGRAGDGGLDGVIDQDALGLDRVYLQAKRYARDNAVGPNAIRDFFGSLDIAKAAKGVFITTSTFTRSARETAERLGKRIVLIDGEQLAALMIRYDVGVRIEETFHIKKVDEDFFLE